MPDPTTDRPAENLAQPPRRAMVSLLVPSLVVNGVLPIVLYQLLKRDGVATVLALVAGSIFPLTYTFWGWARTRRLDLIAGISLSFIVLSAAASLISGSTRFTLVKESFFTGIFGLVFLGSLLAGRPLMFYMARQFGTGGDPERMRQWNARWQHAGFQRTMRVITAIWGVVFVADALIRVGLVFVLSTSVFLVVSQVIFYSMFALMLYGTMSYGRRKQREATRQQATP